MQYHNNEFVNGQIVKITGFHVSEPFYHVVIDGVVYMFHEECYDNRHSFVNEWIVSGYDVMPEMHECNYEATVVIRDIDMEMGGYGDYVSITFEVEIGIGKWIMFGMSHGSCECCGCTDGSFWFSE
jgi:hypothetical protein